MTLSNLAHEVQVSKRLEVLRFEIVGSIQWVASTTSRKQAKTVLADLPALLHEYMDLELDAMNAALYPDTWIHLVEHQSLHAQADDLILATRCGLPQEWQWVASHWLDAFEDHVAADDDDFKCWLRELDQPSWTSSRSASGRPASERRTDHARAILV